MPGGPDVPAARETLPRAQRLLQRADFLTCYRKGRRRHGALLSLYAHPNEAGHPRLGVTASRKVGDSVVRHRLKRQLKEIYRRWNGRSRLPAVDLVVHVKPTARRAEFGRLESELQALLGKLASAAGKASPSGRQSGS